MEEILASIRRIIADDEAKPTADASASAAVRTEASQAAVKVPAPSPAPPRPAAAVGGTNSQDDIDALLAGLDASTTNAEVRPTAPIGDVLELTDDMAIPETAPQTAFQRVEPGDDLEFAEMPPGNEPRRMTQRFEIEDDVDMETQVSPATTQMLSQSTVSAVESAFNTLANTVLSNNARTLEDLVREMLRPMLKSWLDDNLPGLVERIVRAEIERVSRGR